MVIGEVVITQNGVVEEALENDILIAGGAGVVDASKAICAARGHDGVG